MPSCAARRALAVRLPLAAQTAPRLQRPHKLWLGVGEKKYAGADHGWTDAPKGLLVRQSVRADPE